MVAKLSSQILHGEPVEFRFYRGIIGFLVLVIQFLDACLEQLPHATINPAEIDPQDLLLTF